MYRQSLGLGVLSETSALITYLVSGYLTGLASMVPVQVNVYSAAALRTLVTNSVTAVVDAAALTSSNVLIPGNLTDAIQTAYVKGLWSGAFSSAPPRQRTGRWYGATYPAAFNQALEILTPRLLARWVPPTEATGSDPGTTTTVNVDTAGAQNTVNQNEAAAGAATSGGSFFESYGIYVAAALLLLLVFDKGK